MTHYVVLGAGRSLNSLLNFVSAQGGRISKIVCQSDQLTQISIAHPSIPIESWELFVPQADECYLCGLFGKAALALKQQLTGDSGKGDIEILFDTLIHPHAVVSSTACLSAGSVISAGAIVASNVAIGEHCFVEPGVIFGHDTVLESYVTVQMGAKLAGHIRVGEGAIIGMGAIIIEDISIGRYAEIRSGAVVLKDVPAYAVASGVPATWQDP